MIWFFYNLFFSIAFLLMFPKFLSRMAKRGGYRRHFEQRFGIYGKNTTTRLAGNRRFWIHAVSVGELFVAFRLIETYRIKNPQTLFVLSTTTSTGHALAKKKLDPRDVLIYFPLDIPLVMNRALRVIHPLKIILIECEFWPNMIRIAHKRGIPLALINGRISDSSFRGYMMLRVLTRRILRMIDPLCMQSHQDAKRILAMGARPKTIRVLGSAKYDLPPPTAHSATSAQAVLQKIGVPDHARILLGGSTWPGEEKALCTIYKNLKTENPDLFLVLVPRHAERRDEIKKMLDKQSLSFILRSKLSDSIGGTIDVLIVDTTGELMNFYAASHLVFVGKSLCEHGGQNPIEPALFGKAIVVGPNMENFSSVMNDFLSANAIRQVADFQALEKTIRDLLADDSVRERLGEAAHSVIENHRGVMSEMIQQSSSIKS